MASLFPLTLNCLFLLFLLLLLLPPIFYVFNLKRRNPNQPPGPPRLPIIGNLHQLGKLPHRSLMKLSQKYGPVMLLKFGKVPTLVVSSPEIAKEVLKIHDLQCCSRPLTQGARRLSYNFLDVAFAPHNDYRREMRKICVMELFNTQRVKSFAYVREQTVASFINFISQTIPPKPVNLSENMFSILTEIICKIACGRNYQGKEFGNGSHEDAINEAMAMLGSFSASDFIPYVGWIIDVFTGLHARREKCFRKFDKFYQKVIDEHIDPRRTTPEHEDVVDYLLKLMTDIRNEDGCLTHAHIKAIFMNIFLGGIVTSSLTIVWAMTELMNNPRVMKKLQTEIRSCVGKKSMVAETDCENLKYLKMVFKETLRLHPPLVLLLPHQTVEKCKIGGYDINPNTRIQINAFAIGRDPKTWKNPEEFHPERFADISTDFKGQYFEFIPFGAGRRICPGMTMATIGFELILANLLYHFDWELPDGIKRENISLEEEMDINARKKIPLRLVPIKYKWQE